MAASKLQPAITLYRGSLEPGCFVWSCFVTKLETRMRFAGLSYKTAAGSPMSAPKGKIPYIENIRPNATPEMMADSGQIIGNLVADGALPDLNVRLSGTEKAHDMALRALLEDKLYFYNGYEKWHENYYTMRDYSLSAIPGPVRIIIGIMAYRKTMRTMYGQGTARFSWDEITGFIEEIWANVSELLIESKRRAADDGGCFWALGKEEPTEADTVLFGFVVAVLICEAAPTSRKIVEKFPVLEEYASRIREQYFPDYQGW